MGLPALARPSLLIVAAALATAGCNGGGYSPVGDVAFLPSRASIQDLSVTPASPIAGTTVTIRFRVTRTGEARPLFWTSHLVENPPQGGRLSPASGGPLATGSEVEIQYATRGATVAFVTLYPASAAESPTGDGTGDLQSFAIPVSP